MKKISIKPIHLISGKKKTPKNKSNKKLLKSLFKPNKIKRELLEKIKKHQQNKRDAVDSGNKIETTFTNSFQDSLIYLDKVSNNIKKDKKLQKTMKKTMTQLVRPEPKYGILKGGSKPLFSEYKKTLKNNGPLSKNRLKFSLENSFSDDPKPLFVKERQEKLNEIKEKFNPTPIIKKPKKFKKTKTLKKKLILGKHGRKVSVLIKNKKTRKKIHNETLKLKQKSLEEIKQYLRLHNLIKIGTDAPEDVLRETFESSFLSGNVYNKNADNLIHNYINVE